MVPTLFAEPQYQMDDFESFLAYENDRMELLWNAFA